MKNDKNDCIWELVQAINTVLENLKRLQRNALDSGPEPYSIRDRILYLPWLKRECARFGI